LKNREDFPTIVQCLSAARNDREVRFFILLDFCSFW